MLVYDEEKVSFKQKLYSFTMGLFFGVVGIILAYLFFKTMVLIYWPIVLLGMTATSLFGLYPVYYWGKRYFNFIFYLSGLVTIYFIFLLSACFYLMFLK